MDNIFRNVIKHDKDGDGKITAEELGVGNVAMYLTHIDYNLDNVIDREELNRFYLRYNNGRGIEESILDLCCSSSSRHLAEHPATFRECY